MKNIAGKLLLLFFLLQCMDISAQQWGNGERPKIGTVKGIVFDGVSKKPIEYANITILRKQDSSLVTGTISAPDGKFLIEQLEPGIYLVRFGFIGFNDSLVPNVRITPKEPLMNFDTIFLWPADVTLDDIEVIAEKVSIEYNLDKQIFNVDKDLTTTGGTGLDVMKNIPSVSVDVDGNVSLRGSGNVNILIDGKPSSISPTQLLEQIPASMIERIEVITNPSARYDPDGMSGIINVVTKKSKTPGYNGTINLTAGTGNKYTGTVTMNFKKNKLNLFGSYDARYNQFFHKSSSERTFGTDTLTRLDQTTDRLRTGLNHTGKLGMDYAFNDFNALTLSGTFRTGTGNSNEDINYNTFDASSVKSDSYVRTVEELDTDYNFDIQLFYQKKFKQKGRELTFDSNWSERDEIEEIFALQEYTLTDYADDDSETQQRNTSGNKNRVITFQVDYVHPTEKKGRFETGLKVIVRDIENSLLMEDYDYFYSQWIENPLISNTFQYNDEIYSAYFIYSNVIKKKLQVQGGIRAEQTFTHSYQVTIDSTFNYDYFNIFPSIHTKLPLKNQAEIMVSYSRRINRPGTWSLNPFPDYSDPFNLRFGNPYLKPEFINSYEAGYMRYFKKWSVASTLFHRQTKDLIVRFRTVDETGVSRMSQLNLTESNSTGVDLVVTLNPSQKLRVMLSGSAYYFLQDAREDYNLREVKNFQWNAKFNSSYTIKKGFDLQLSGFYHAPMQTSQGEMLAMYSMDVATKLDVLKGNGSISLRVSDVFNTRRFSIVSEGPGFYIDSYFKRESRIAILGFTYKINGGNNRREKRPDFNQGGGNDGEW